MRQIQGSFITGYITIIVKGDSPELFFQACLQNGITPWNVKSISEDKCQGNVKLRDMEKIEIIKNETNYTVTVIKERGYPLIIKRLVKAKHAILAIIMSILLIIFLSNVLWKVTITGVTKEIEEKISKSLDSYGVHQGSWIFLLNSPGVIQQKLINDIPDLLWVGVHKKGTTFILEGVEKTIVKEKEIHAPRNLIASKKGVIKSIYVSVGVPKVRVNDHVNPGDLLVSGSINNDEIEEEKDNIKEEDIKHELVSAEGKVTAETWYETSVTVPLETNYELLTGSRKKKYYLRMGDLHLPVFGFGTPDYKEVQIDRDEKALYFLKWKLPVSFVESILSEKVYNEMNRTKEEAINIGVKQAKNELQLQLGFEASILSEKVLHESMENGKVKLIIYITVEEDIAKVEPITQGD